MITFFLIDEIVPQSIDMAGRSGADVSTKLWHRTATRRDNRSTLLRRQSWVPLPNRAAALSEQTILTARTDTTTFKRSKHFHAANGTTAANRMHRARVPQVRIHLPPAESRTNYRFRCGKQFLAATGHRTGPAAEASPRRFATPKRWNGRIVAR